MPSCPQSPKRVVGLVHRADVLQRDVVVVVQACGRRRRGTAAYAASMPGFSVAAARLAVRRELRRRAVDEAGEDRTRPRRSRPRRNVRPGASSAELLRRTVGRRDADAAAADVVAVARERDAARREQQSARLRAARGCGNVARSIGHHAPDAPKPSIVCAATGSTRATGRLVGVAAVAGADCVAVVAGETLREVCEVCELCEVDEQAASARHTTIGPAARRIATR